MEDLKSALENFHKKKILVVGDIMLDHYIYGRVERISPEAPVPVVFGEKENFVPGGAGNTSSNISSLGAESYLIGKVGDDAAGRHAISAISGSNIDISGVFVDEFSRTTEKIRLISMGQQIARLDWENTERINDTLRTQITKHISSLKIKFDAVVVSDYAKDLFSYDLANAVKDFAKKQAVPVIVDTKPANFSLFRGVRVITPNRKEAEEICKHRISTEEEIRNAAGYMAMQSGSDILITLGADGMALFMHNHLYSFPSFAKDVYDVTGAGDTVVAALALAIASGTSLKDAAIVANHAAAIAVGKSGTASVTLEELQRFMA